MVTLQSETGPKRITIAAIALPLLLGLSLWLLWPGIQGPFVFDDFPNLQNLREIGDQFSRESIGRYLAAWHGSPGRPLAALSFLIEDHAWPTDPEAFKRNNLLWHLLVGIGVFLLARKLIVLSNLGHSKAFWIALATMFYWLVHPMQLSSTMLVVQRMTVLSNGLIVAGLLIYLTILTSPRLGYIKRALLAASSLFAFSVLAFLAKENGPLIFVYATVLNLTLLAPTIRQLSPRARQLLWLATAGMTVVLTLAMLWQVRDPGSAYAMRDFTLGQRLLSEARILWHYLLDILLPNMKTSIFHDDFPLSTGLLTPWTTLLAVLGWLTAVSVAVLTRHRLPLLSFSILWFLAGHLIESTIIPLELYFEHRNYLAMLGPIMGTMVVLLNAAGDVKKPLRAAGLVWLLLAAFTGHVTATTWGKPIVLAETWHTENPKSVRATEFLASTYARNGLYNDAKRVLTDGLTELEDPGAFNFQLALLHCMYGKAGPKDFRGLIEIATGVSRARIVPDVMNALRTHVGSKYCGDALSTSMYLDIMQALLKNSHYADPEMKAHLHYLLAEFYLMLDKPNPALDQFRKSYKAKAVSQVALNEASIAISLGRFDHAEDALHRAAVADRPIFERLIYPTAIQIERAEAKLKYMQGISGINKK